MLTHDPRQVVEDLRNHFAAGDRHLAFLFGAGTSSAINIAPPAQAGQRRPHQPLIPGAAALTEKCGEQLTALGAVYAAAWDAVRAQCGMNGGRADVEAILSKIRMKIEAIGDGEVLLGLTREQLLEAERAVCQAIARAVQPVESDIPSETPHDSFASWVKRISRSAPMELFTTNYDILLERALESAHVPVFDGFVGAYRPFFYPDCLEDEALLPAPGWVRLWKLHGSVNWDSRGGTSGGVIVRGQSTTQGALIFPSHLKYDESRKQPYVAYMDRLSRVLNHEHSLLVTCGYSFSDAHINAIIYGALDARRTANVVALSYGGLSEEAPLVQFAKRRPNLTVIGGNGGAISGTWGHWKLTKPIDATTHSFMDLAFDSSASPEVAQPGVTPGGLDGRMRLGDFNWLARFLDDMGGGR